MFIPYEHYLTLSFVVIFNYVEKSIQLCDLKINLWLSPILSDIISILWGYTETYYIPVI